MPLLHDELVYLRPPTRDELTFIQALWSDPDTMADVGGTHVLTDESAEKWYRSWVDPGAPSRCYCLVFRTRDDHPVGEVCFYSYEPIAKSAKFSINIHAKYRGRGYSKHAMFLMLHYFFSEFGGDVMIDDIALDNVRGQQALLNFGFEQDPSLSEVFLVKLGKEQFLRLYG